MPDLNARKARIDEIQRELMEEPDSGRRARLHLELARLAVTEGRMDKAARHLREALHLDQRLEQARSLLGELGEVSRIVPRKPGAGRRSAVRGLLGRLRRRP